jgi:hypothetical protein
MGVSPPEPCSSRAAVRRLRRRFPHGVEAAAVFLRRPPTSRKGRSPAPSRRAPWWKNPKDVPRLQGLAPHESPPLHPGCLGPRTRVALLGFLPPGHSPSMDWQRPSPPPPLMRLCERATNRPSAPSTGCHFQRGWLVSLETAGPPGIPRLMTLRKSSGWTRLGSHLLESRGALPSPADSL